MSSSGGSRGGAAVQQGTSGTRPAATANALRYETDTGEWLIGNSGGTAWQTLASTGHASIGWAAAGVFFNGLGDFANTITRNGGNGHSLINNNLDTQGGIFCQGAGSGLNIAGGSNAKIGTATLVAGAVTVSNTSVTANSKIIPFCLTQGGTPGFLRVSATTVGTGFTVTSSSGTDTSVIGYLIVESF